MRTFLFIWIGQVVSLLGSKLTEFALGVWVYQQTESLTQFAFVVLCMYLPNLLVSPFAGAIIDRWDRRWAMILSDLAAGISTLTVMGLLWTNSLQVWHIYLVVMVVSFADAFQIPAYTAAIGQLVPNEHLSRANGMVQISKAIAKIAAPFVAGFLIELVALKGVLLIDFCTFTVAAFTLLLVRFPTLKTASTYPIESQRLWQEIVSGWHYILAKPSLLGLTSYVAMIYFTMGMLEVLFWPFILDFSSSADLGRVLSIGGCGMLLGGLTISIWGGPQRRIYGIFAFVPVQGMALLLGSLDASLYLAALGIFAYLFAQPIIISCNRAIWQSKIPLGLQGRIFALQQALERSLSILAYVIAGPLVERVISPFVASDGFLTTGIGRLIGTGMGQEIRLLLFAMGSILIFVTLVVCQLPQLRRIEAELPDEGDAALAMVKARSTI
ncbi:MFS transporter [Hydrococcus rivularis NIES-593]|uniref:MFS transporter n=1 Tax=Hydrococcus rivularis NIES-593 TaxID=1921803 RepID=A0A1U7HSV4_9CYAN|nr:MFS transporter [Hydrococcus rivularis]OKH26680.1 MFS transporter [Hydrococcus rivularis NIES-593]